MNHKIRKKLDKKFSLCARSVPDIRLEEVIKVAMDTGYHAVGFALERFTALTTANASSKVLYSVNMRNSKTTPKPRSIA